MQKGSLVSVCSNCKQVFNFRNVGFTSKPTLIEGIEDVGIECPNCEAFVHSYYLNDELKAMQNPKATRKVRRAYKHKFLKLQRWVEKKLRQQNGRAISG